MKYAFQFLITSILMIGQTAIAGPCEDKLKGTSIPFGDTEIPRLCSNAVDAGPAWCFLLSPARLTDFKNKIDHSVTLCRGATQEDYRMPIKCLNQVSANLSVRVATLACSGAHNTAPADCLNTLAAMEDEKRKARYPHGFSTTTNDQVAAVCRHSVNAVDTLVQYALMLRDYPSQSKPNVQAIKRAMEFNESRY